MYAGVCGRHSMVSGSAVTTWFAQRSVLPKSAQRLALSVVGGDFRSPHRPGLTCAHSTASSVRDQAATIRIGLSSTPEKAITSFFDEREGEALGIAGLEQGRGSLSSHRQGVLLAIAHRHVEAIARRLTLRDVHIRLLPVRAHGARDRDVDQHRFASAVEQCGVREVDEDGRLDPDDLRVLDLLRPPPLDEHEPGGLRLPELERGTGGCHGDRE